MANIIALLEKLTPHTGPNYAAACLALLRKPVLVPRLVGGLDIQPPGQDGVRRLNTVQHYIEVIPLRMPELGCVPLPPKQQAIAALFMRTCLPSIVTPLNWVPHRRKYLEMLGETDACMMAGVIAARQNGKSWTIAVCCAAVMMACPGISIGVYASKLAQAEVIQDYVVQVLRAFGFPFTRVKTEHVLSTDTVPKTTLSCYGFNA